MLRQCFYPEADDDFELEDYLGRWYQVAGTVAPFTEGCTCIFAEYSLNVCHDRNFILRGTFTKHDSGRITP